MELIVITKRYGTESRRQTYSLEGLLAEILGRLEEKADGAESMLSFDVEIGQSK